MNWSHGHEVTRSRDHKMVRRSKFQLPFHVMWWIQTFDLGVGDNLICFPVYHIYFFVGKGQSLYPNWRCWIFLPPICHCKQHHQMEPEGKVRNQTSDLTELLVVFQVRLFQGRLRLVLQRLQLGCVFLSKSSYFQVFSRAPE